MAGCGAASILMSVRPSERAPRQLGWPVKAAAVIAANAALPQRATSQLRHNEASPRPLTLPCRVLCGAAACGLWLAQCAPLGPPFSPRLAASRPAPPGGGLGRGPLPPLSRRRSPAQPPGPALAGRRETVRPRCGPLARATCKPWTGSTGSVGGRSSGWTVPSRPSSWGSPARLPWPRLRYGVSPLFAPSPYISPCAPRAAFPEHSALHPAHAVLHRRGKAALHFSARISQLKLLFNFAFASRPPRALLALAPLGVARAAGGKWQGGRGQGGAAGSVYPAERRVEVARQRGSEAI